MAAAGTTPFLGYWSAALSVVGQALPHYDMVGPGCVHDWFGAVLGVSAEDWLHDRVNGYRVDVQ